MSLKSTEELSVTTVKNYAKFGGTNLSFQSWHEEFDEFWPLHLKVSKIFTLMGSFWTKYIVWAKKVYTEELSFIKMKRDTKFGEESTCGFMAWQVLTWALESFTNFHFNGLLLSKVYIVQAKKVQRSYLSWNWRGIQNL